MRILLVCDDYPSAFAGGVATSVTFLARGLGSIGHDVILVWPEEPNKISIPGVRQIRMPVRKINFGQNHAFIALPFTTKILPEGWIPEVVHSMQPTPVSIMLKNLSKTWQAPLLISMHTILEQTFHPVLQKALSIYAPWVFRMADVTVTPNDFATTYANNRFNLSRKAKTMTNSIDLTTLRALATEPREEIKNRTIRLCSAISLLPYKNPIMMLEIMAGLIARGLSVSLHLAGKGPMLEELKLKATALNLSQAVTFTGPLAQPELMALFKRSDAFLLTSHMEIQPMVLLESKAVGTPAFVSDAPLNGGKGLIRDGIDGVLFPVNDLNKAINIIAQALSNPQQLQNMGEQAFLDAENYDLEGVAQQAIDLYENTIQELRSRK